MDRPLVGEQYMKWYFAVIENDCKDACGRLFAMWLSCIASLDHMLRTYSGKHKRCSMRIFVVRC